MCVILDNSARDNVFGRRSGTPVGRQLLEWLDEFRTSLVVGGKLYDELAESRVFEVWGCQRHQGRTLEVFQARCGGSRDDRPREQLAWEIR